MNDCKRQVFWLGPLLKSSRSENSDILSTACGCVPAGPYSYGDSAGLSPDFPFNGALAPTVYGGKDKVNGEWAMVNILLDASVAYGAIFFINRKERKVISRKGAKKFHAKNAKKGKEDGRLNYSLFLRIVCSWCPNHAASHNLFKPAKERLAAHRFE